MPPIAPKPQREKIPFWFFALNIACMASFLALIIYPGNWIVETLAIGNGLAVSTAAWKFNLKDLSLLIGGFSLILFAIAIFIPFASH